MSSTIVHSSGLTLAAGAAAAAVADPAVDDKNPALLALGEQVRRLRAQRGMTRKAVVVTHC